MGITSSSVGPSTSGAVPDGLGYQDQSRRGDQITGSQQRRRPLSLPAHALARAARRSSAPDAVDYVLTHGRRIQRTGVIFYFLGKRDMPPADQCGSGVFQAYRHARHFEETRVGETKHCRYAVHTGQEANAEVRSSFIRAATAPIWLRISSGGPFNCSATTSSTLPTCTT